jgi:hypothetical protein
MYTSEVCLLEALWAWDIAEELQKMGYGVFWNTAGFVEVLE